MTLAKWGSFHGGNLRAAAAKYGVAADEIIDFSANINPLGPPPGVVQIIQENMHMIGRYPDPDCFDLKRGAATYYGVDVNTLIPGNGAAELIYLIVYVLRPRRVLIPVPTFSEYEQAALAAGAEIKPLPLRRAQGFAIKAEEVVPELPEVDMVFLCNPNNPAGNLIAPGDLELIINAAAEYQVFLLLDESFLDFVPDRSDRSCIRLATDSPNMLVLSSLTKFFALPGLRLGFGITHPDLVSRLARGKDPWNVNVFAQLAGLVAMADQSYIAETIKLIKTERDFLVGELSKIPGIRVLTGAANFLLLDISLTGWGSTDLTDCLARQGVLVRNCSSYPLLGEDFIRVAVKSRRENTILVNALQNIGLPCSPRLW